MRLRHAATSRRARAGDRQCVATAPAHAVKRCAWQGDGGECQRCAVSAAHTPSAPREHGGTACCRAFLSVELLSHRVFFLSDHHGRCLLAEGLTTLVPSFSSQHASAQACGAPLGSAAPVDALQGPCVGSWIKRLVACGANCRTKMHEIADLQTHPRRTTTDIQEHIRLAVRATGRGIAVATPDGAHAGVGSLHSWAQGRPRGSSRILASSARHTRPWPATGA